MTSDQLLVIRRLSKWNWLPSEQFNEDYTEEEEEEDIHATVTNSTLFFWWLENWMEFASFRTKNLRRAISIIGKVNAVMLYWAKGAKLGRISIYKCNIFPRYCENSRLLRALRFENYFLPVSIKKKKKEIFEYFFFKLSFNVNFIIEISNFHCFVTIVIDTFLFSWAVKNFEKIPGYLSKSPLWIQPWSVQWLPRFYPFFPWEKKLDRLGKELSKVVPSRDFLK